MKNSSSKKTPQRSKSRSSKALGVASKNSGPSEHAKRQSSSRAINQIGFSEQDSTAQRSNAPLPKEPQQSEDLN
ncbi:MAG: hypothetical protein Q8916_13785 [Bacteroidota bacterium]|nr:hypothetical protein [Bacteroidota bacterium]MDP4234995.1 hypothetical protein [Bacteroidota bacterium]